MGVLVNPIALTVADFDEVLHAPIMKKNYHKKMDACPFAFTGYQKELNALKGCLRIKEFHEDILLFEFN